MPAVLCLECTLVQEFATSQRAYFKIKHDPNIAAEDELATNGQLAFTVNNPVASLDFVRGQTYHATLTLVE